ncbi:MAG: TIGR02449 family protein [Pseudomonadales bacterium]
MNVVTDQSEQLDQLARRVDDLIALTELLTTENRALRAQQQQWSQERDKLIEKNQTATTSVEAMITRLKSLERG